jgi:hypothetical protein
MLRFLRLVVMLYGLLLAVLISVRQLASLYSVSGGDYENGQRLYIQWYCGVCHDQSVLAPATVGTYWRVVNERLKDPANAGKTVQQYLAESILRPDDYVPPNFAPGVMPRGYTSEITLRELKDLVAFFMAQKF